MPTACYVGYCPDLFPWGGVGHGKTEEETYRALCALVHEEVEEMLQAGKELPPASTRPMREAVHLGTPTEEQGGLRNRDSESRCRGYLRRAAAPLS